MKTLEERMKEIQTEADRNIERLKREYEMKAKLDVPLEYDTPQTVGCNLYGSKISAILLCWFISPLRQKAAGGRGIVMAVRTYTVGGPHGLPVHCGG